MSEWIKCSDRLPEEGAKVIARTTEKQFVSARFTCDVFIVVVSCGNCEFEAVFRQFEITHWQPLPEAQND